MTWVPRERLQEPPDLQDVVARPPYVCPGQERSQARDDSWINHRGLFARSLCL